MQRTKHQKALIKQRRRRLAVFMADSIQFTCAHCGADVPWRDSQDARNSTTQTMRVGSHDACPECEWSRHVAYGTDDLPPCGEMMEPVESFTMPVKNVETGDRIRIETVTGELIDIPFVRRRCLGCGWETTAPLQKVQRFDILDDVSLTRWGKDGNGKAMESEFTDHAYVISRLSWKDDR